MTTTNPRRGGLPTNLPIQSRMRTALDAAEFAARNGRPDAVIQHMCPECGAVRPALDWCTLCQGTGSVPDGMLTATATPTGVMPRDDQRRARPHLAV